MLNRVSVNQGAQLTSLTSSLRQYSPKVVENTVNLLQPYLPEGASMPDVALFLQLILELFHDSGTKLIETSRERLGKNAGDSNLRDVRDSVVEGLRSKLFRIKNLFQGALGPAGPRMIDLDNGVQVLPNALLIQVDYVDVRLRDPTLLDGMEVWGQLEPLELAELLNPELGILRSSIATLTAEQRASEASMLEQRKIQAECRRHYVGGGKIIEGLYRIGDMPDEADRLRLVQRQTRGTGEETSSPDGEVSDTGSSPDGNPPDGRDSETGEGDDTAAAADETTDGRDSKNRDSDSGDSDSGDSDSGTSEDVIA